MAISEKQLLANRKNAKKAGRPKGSIDPLTRARKEAERLFIEEAEKHMPELVQALIHAAKGIVIEKENADGTTQIYAKAPDVQALKEYFDRVIGKSNQQVSLDITTKGKSVQVAAIEQLTQEINEEEEADIEEAYDDIEEKTT